MMINPEAWLGLADDERTQILVEPFTVSIDAIDNRALMADSHGHRRI